MGFKETSSSLKLRDAKSILKTTKVDLKYLEKWAKKQSTIKILKEIKD